MSTVPIPACECGAPVHEGPHDAALSAPATGCDGGHPGCSVCDAADARAEQPPTMAGAIAIVNACRGGIKRIEDAMDRRAGKLREMRAAPWRPSVGARVVTANPLTRSYLFAPEFNRDRRAGVTGAVREVSGYGRHASYHVTHDDGTGTDVPYDADELFPAPEVSK